MKSVMKHEFSGVPRVPIERSTFDRSHGFKTTLDASYLIPVYVDEVLPGDNFNLSMTGFARLSTPTYPIMDNCFLETFFFFVPYRLVWSNWQRFMGERDPDPDSSIDYTVPIIDDLQNPSNMTLWDYFGLPTLVNAIYEFNALIPRSYNKIWNDWFRDENLQDSVTVNIDDGPDSEADYTLLKRGKRHDYFTSALPWLQRGDAVLMSLGDTADIYHDAADGAKITTYNTTHSGWHGMSAAAATLEGVTSAGVEANKLYVDLSTAVGPTINELREAVQVQRLLEKDARAGTRYIEIIKSHFGVDSDDARLQRSEYLGGGSTPIVITPIARTDSSPGELGAMGTTGFKGHGFVKTFKEHGCVIGLCSIRADLTYQEGIERMWNRQTRYDYYWPVLGHLGEQSILNKEIYVDAVDIGAGTTEEVFGYQERYAEYRYKPSKITGKLRSNDPATLDAWHLGIEFGATPTLDNTFIEDTAVTAIDRVIVTPTEPQFIMDSYFNLKCTRPMPIYSVPGMMDHF